MGDPKNKQAGLHGLGRVRDTENHRILRRGNAKDYTLDIDAMQVDGEKTEANFTYKGDKGYMPMLGFLFEPAISGRGTNRLPQDTRSFTASAKLAW